MDAEEIQTFITTLPMEQQPRTAEDLAKAFARDKDATTEKYDNKYVLLTGKIKGTLTVTADKYLDSTLTAEFENAGDTRLYANVDLPPVNANFDLLDAKGRERIRLGEEIKVLGKCSFKEHGKEGVFVNGCLVVE